MARVCLNGRRFNQRGVDGSRKFFEGRFASRAGGTRMDVSIPRNDEHVGQARFKAKLRADLARPVHHHWIGPGLLKFLADSSSQEPWHAADIGQTAKFDASGVVRLERRHPAIDLLRAFLVGDGEDYDIRGGKGEALRRVVLIAEFESGRGVGRSLRRFASHDLASDRKAGHEAEDKNLHAALTGCAVATGP